MNIQGYSAINPYKSYGSTTRATKSTEETKQAEAQKGAKDFKNTGDYLKHLTSKYEYLQKGTVNISTKALRQAMDDPKKAALLEDKLGALSSSEEMHRGLSKADGIKLVSISWEISEITDSVSGTINTITSGKQTKNATKKNTMQEMIEKLQEKRLEDKAAEKLEDKTLEAKRLNKSVNIPDKFYA